eukprot:m.207096 g.207096  ORF g.207096 m.207096 type:complete len:73 (-) comp17120_c0_seq7:1652-1870(-)
MALDLLHLASLGWLSQANFKLSLLTLQRRTSKRLQDANLNFTLRTGAFAGDLQARVDLVVSLQVFERQLAAG